MTANELLARFQSRGINITLAGADLSVTPWRDLTDEDRQAIRDYKAELIEALQPKGEVNEVKPEVREDNQQNRQKTAAGKWKSVNTSDMQIAAERHRRRAAGEDDRDLPTAAEIPTLDARAKRKPDPLPSDGMCPGRAEPPRYQGHDTWWCPTCRRWFQAADGSEPSEPRIEDGAPVPSPMPEPLWVGTWARPVILRGTRMPQDCPWRTCNGWLVGSNPVQCTGCKTVFELKPPLTGTCVDDAGEAAEWAM